MGAPEGNKNAAGPHSGAAKSMLRSQVMRNFVAPGPLAALGQEKPESVYAHRGITQPEHDYIAKHGHIQSNMSFSHESEGTNFADNPGDAESYVNFGRDDPQKTGRANYVLKVHRKDAGERARDGYIKTKAKVPDSSIVGVRRFNPDGSVTEGHWESGKGFSPGPKKGKD